MNVILGVNHQFLYPQAMVDPVVHTESLTKLAQSDKVAALDCWTWPEAARAKEEQKMLRDSGKWINYNIGDRPGDEPVFGGSPDAARRQRGYDITMREFEYALNCGAKKIIFGSGADVPENREAAKEHYAEFLLKAGAQVPKDVLLCLEPVDRDIDKCALLGPAKESADFIRGLWKEGLTNLRMLLDMGHVPIMYETMESGIAGAGDTLAHIHLGNCLISDKSNPLYGDKHPVWDVPGSEFGAEDGKTFLHLLHKYGYFENEKDCTVSFEMRCYDGLTPEETLAKFVEIYENAMSVLPALK